MENYRQFGLSGLEKLFKNNILANNNNYYYH